MKKLLLLGATALMTASSAWGGVRYVQVGDPISDISQMKNDDHGGLYCLQVYKKGDDKSGFLYSQNQNLKE